MNVRSLGRAVNGIVGSDFSDPTNERIIYLSAAGLGIVGLGLLVGTILWWRRGRQEHPSLAPLEVMGGRAWAKAPEGDRRRRLEQVRVAGAEGSADGPGASEPVDLQALVRSVPQAFDDLREPDEAIALPVASEPVPVDVAKADVVVDPEKPAERVEPAKVEEEVAKPAEKVEAAKVDEEVAKSDPDATAVSIERPEEAFESFAPGRTEPSA